MIDKKSLSPCIISWAKFALKLKGKLKPKNNKKCSKEYWIKVIDTLLLEERFKNLNINRSEAINEFELWIK